MERDAVEDAIAGDVVAENPEAQTDARHRRIAGGLRRLRVEQDRHFSPSRVRLSMVDVAPRQNERWED
jgi:hypothetical protein